MRPPLQHRMKLIAQMDRTGVAVGGEESTDALPELECSLIVGDRRVDDIIHGGAVQPCANAVVGNNPNGARAARK